MKKEGHIIQKLFFLKKYFNSLYSHCLSVTKEKYSKYVLAKPSLKIGTANAICSLGLFRDYGLNYIFFRNKTFLFFKIESWNVCLKKNFVKPHKISTHSAHSENFYFHFFYPLSDWVEILWGFMKFFFKQMLKISAFYLEKQKSFIPKKNIFWP